MAQAHHLDLHVLRDALATMLEEQWEDGYLIVQLLIEEREPLLVARELGASQAALLGMSGDARDACGAAYREQLSLRLDGPRTGIVQEGFGWEGKSEAEVDETVREAARGFTDLGAVVRDVAIPLHRDGVHTWSVIGTEGTLTTMIQGDCAGRGWKGEYPTELLAFFGEMWRKKGRDLPPMVR